MPILTYRPLYFMGLQNLGSRFFGIHNKMYNFVKLTFNRKKSL